MIYTAQKGGQVPLYSIDSIRCIQGIFLLSGYNKIPNRRMYWETRADSHNELISSAMKIRDFEYQLRYLHFADNSKNDEKDKFYKVRPIFEVLNNTSSQFASLFNNFSIDESMIPYFGNNSSKQFIRGKPIRYGYKVWSLCSSEGFSLWSEPYCGASTAIDDHGFGQGPNVVLTLANKCNLPPGANLFFDNLFTSVPLVKKLSEMGRDRDRNYASK